MRARPNPVEALATLARVSDAAERRASWRQAVAALGQNIRVSGAPPLDGVAPDVLVRAAQIALETNLADDLDWIAPGAAAVALFELSSVLPAGQERRDFGRRVFARLYEGTASTFAAVATRMAFGSGKQLDTPTLRARIGLVFDLPIGTSVNPDALALALVSRRSLMQRWLVLPSTGALPARRMSAKLLEHAAREAVMRSLQGDSYPRELLVGDGLRPILNRLLHDREPLVWRHAAVARGILATVDGRIREEIELALDPSLTPTEWRRAAVSMAAMLMSEPRETLRRLKKLLESDLVQTDPGLPATLVYGLPRAIEQEPDAAEELLDRLAATRRPDVAEATAGLLGECLSPSFGARAAATLHAAVSARMKQESSAARGLLDRALRVLGRHHLDDTTTSAQVRRALTAFETTGARAAHDLAVQAAAGAQRAVEAIAALNAPEETVAAHVLQVLGDLDESMLERGRLSDLLLLSRKPGDTDLSVPVLDRLYHALGNWLLDSEQRAIEADWSPSGEIVSQRRLRCLLHLVDLETARQDDDARVRSRVRRSIQVLLGRLVVGPDASVHRILCATLARTFDAAIREGVAEPADLLALAIHQLSDRQTIETLSDASLAPEMSDGLSAYGAFLARRSREAADADVEAEFPDGAQDEDEAALAQRIIQLSRGLGAGGSYRGESLRQVMLRLGRALDHIATARGLSELVDTAGSSTGPVNDLEHAIDSLRQLTSGAHRRVLGHEMDLSGMNSAPVSNVIERALSAGIPAPSQQIAAAIGELTAALPQSLEEIVARVVSRIDALPVAGASDVFSIPLEKRRSALPDWLLPRRTIGAFYVVRALGSGGVSSVFVVRRFEERHNPKAEAFALKVPEYDPTTARSLSEQEFLQLFREEAGALLSLPSHANLARFVTFDLAARPKPILVMELIRGFALDRLIRSRSLSMANAARYLLGILSGLEAMHKVGVGHLDIKPSNVILRDGETPVLVDFGLSGRHLRPGCGTLEYCAPEVLGVTPAGFLPTATAADVYAFACTAFEILTAQTLFDADDEMTLASLHVSHDGWPVKLVNLSSHPGYRDLCVILAACLRHDPRARPTAPQVRAALSAALRPLSDSEWPLAPARAMEAAS
jgi:hypothetical protein